MTAAARPPLMPRSSTSFAGRAGFGHSGNTDGLPQPAVERREALGQASGGARSGSACRACAAVAASGARPCRDQSAARRASRASRPASGRRCLRRMTGRIGDRVVERPSATAALRVAGERTASRRNRSPRHWPRASCRQRRRRAPRRRPTTPGTRAARHSSAAPAPVPPSSTRSPAGRGSRPPAAPARCPLRSPVRGWS